MFKIVLRSITETVCSLVKTYYVIITIVDLCIIYTRRHVQAAATERLSHELVERRRIDCWLADRWFGKQHTYQATN